MQDDAIIFWHKQSSRDNYLCSKMIITNTISLQNNLINDIVKNANVLLLALTSICL